jgi:hypothetical protein
LRKGLRKVLIRASGKELDNDPRIEESTRNIEKIEARDKTRLLKTTFIPAPPGPDLHDINSIEYQNRIPFPDTTERDAKA